MDRFPALLAVVVLLCLNGPAAEGNPPNLVASTSLNATPASPILTIRKSVEEVRVSFHALDRSRRPVLNLAPHSVMVVDNGVPVRAIAGFDVSADLPLSVALMVDASDSVARDFAAEKEASAAFIHTLVRSSDDRVLLVSFRDKVEMVRRMTGNAAELTASLREIKVGGLTSLYDALASTSDRLARSDPSAGRRAIVIITDGDDTDSYRPLDEAIAATIRNDVAVYTISLRGKHMSLHGQDVLKRIAEASGGLSYLLRRREELSNALREIERDLRTQYLITYRPQLDNNGFHTLKLSTTDKDVLIRARSGYFALNQN